MCDKKFVVCIAIKKYLFANGVLIITFLFSTLEHVEGETIQEEEHMSTSETTPLSSTIEAGEEHSTSLFINKTLVIIITQNIDLTFISYCG